MQYNILQALFSGIRGFKEEFASQLLAFFLAPHMPHGMGTRVLEAFLREIGEEDVFTGKWENCAGNYYCSDILEDIRGGKMGCGIQIEAAPAPADRGRIDILIRLENTLIVVENKIFHQSVGDVCSQMDGYVNTLNKVVPTDIEIIPVIIVPSGYSCHFDRNDVRLTSWSKLAEILLQLLEVPGDEPGRALLADFCSYTAKYYHSYPSASKAPVENCSFEEYMAALPDEELRCAVRKVLETWFIACGGSRENFRPEQVYCGLNDGPVMWVNIREKGAAGRVRQYFPFKISRKGTFIMQVNVLRKQQINCSNVLEALREKGIFASGKESCSVKTAAENAEYLAGYIFPEFLEKAGFYLEK